MSPSRSKAIVRPSGLTSTFIQVPSFTFIGTCRSRAPGGAFTSQALASALAAAPRAGLCWATAAVAVVESIRTESAARLRNMDGDPLRTRKRKSAVGALSAQHRQGGVDGPYGGG